MESSGGKFFLGYNKMSPKKSIHAEINVMTRWINLNTGIKNKKINMVIIRVNNNGNLLESYPCAQCIANLVKLCKQHNINLNWVYYSCKYGQIHKIKFSAIIKSTYRHKRKKD
jgi:cytidine deaminase